MDRNLPFTNEHKMFKEAVKKFVVNEIVPFYEQWRKDGMVPHSLYSKMGELGFLCPYFDEQYGGVGGDFLYSVILNEEIARKGMLDIGVGLDTDVVPPYIETFGTQEQKAKWLPGIASGDIVVGIALTEPGAGSDLKALRTTATKCGNNYVLNGSKTFISNGLLADLFIVAAKTDVNAGAKGISLFVVERGMEGFERGNRINKLGFHAQDTAELFFDNCIVPPANLLGQENNGFKMMMQKLQQERLVTTIQAQAAAERCLELAVEYVKTRTLFDRPLSSFQNTQFVLAEVATEVQLGRTFVDALIMNHMDKKNVVQEVSMAKYWVAEMCNRVAARCLQLFGGYGYCEEYEISRLWTDSRIFSIFAGTSEVMKVLVSRGLGL